MVTISAIVMTHWKCFQGKQRLELEPKTYAISARDANDEQRSNWLGKSSLTEAVDYALTGRRPRDARLKSDWITEGEATGEVRLELSDGSVVIRSMGRKESERLWYYPPGKPTEGATQDAAQERIDAMLGLAREDASTWCFRQGEMAALLSMDPGPRLKMFTDWMRLEKLDDCMATTSATRAELERRVEAVRGDAAKAVGAIASMLSHRGLPATEAGVEDLQELAEDASRRVRDMEAKVAELERAAEAGREKARLSPRAARYDAVVAEGKELATKHAARTKSRAQLIDERVAARAARDAALDARNVAARELDAVVAVAEGAFDGRCPIAGAACPSAAFVEAETVRNRARRAALGRAAEEAEVAFLESHRASNVADVALAEWDDEHGKLDTLRFEARALKPERERWAAISEDAGPSVQERADADQALDADKRELAELLSALKFCEDARAALEAARAEVARLEAAAAVPSAAYLVFDRARKKIAEDVLAEMEAHANGVLQATDVDLSVRLAWGRDGEGLADACSSCGAAFPASRKVKSCGRCGAERGAKVQERLDILPSRRSGAADDFAGIAVALGASRWLREDRGSVWATCVLDEPHAKMDAGNRRRFTSKLDVVLRQAGFAQAFIVSHSRDSSDGLPGRIEIVSKGGRSTARVVA